MHELIRDADVGAAWNRLRCVAVNAEGRSVHRLPSGEERGRIGRETEIAVQSFVSGQTIVLAEYRSSFSWDLIL